MATWVNQVESLYANILTGLNSLVLVPIALTELIQRIGYVRIMSTEMHM